MLSMPTRSPEVLIRFTHLIDFVSILPDEVSALAHWRPHQVSRILFSMVNCVSTCLFTNEVTKGPASFKTFPGSPSPITLTHVPSSRGAKVS